MGIIETLIIVCATAVVVWVLARIGNSRQAARTMLLQTENDTLKAQAEQLQRQTEELRQQHSVAAMPPKPRPTASKPNSCRLP